MCIGKKFIVPVVCMAAFTVFGQGAPNVGKSVEELKKYINIGTITCFDNRNNQNQKMTVIKVSTDQDKDMKFEGVMRLTVELKGDSGEVWYGQTLKAQGKWVTRADYAGTDNWEFQMLHGSLKYPEVAYAVEYGYQTTNKTFVVVRQVCKKVESADEIMTRNKGSKNLLKIAGKVKGDVEGDVPAE